MLHILTIVVGQEAICNKKDIKYWCQILKDYLKRTKFGYQWRISESLKEKPLDFTCAS